MSIINRTKYTSTFDKIAKQGKNLAKKSGKNISYILVGKLKCFFIVPKSIIQEVVHFMTFI